MGLEFPQARHLIVDRTPGIVAEMPVVLVQPQRHCFQWGQREPVFQILFRQSVQAGIGRRMGSGCGATIEDEGDGEAQRGA